MSDDGFERWVRDAARGYNAPPRTPKDEMWSRIAASRAQPVRRTSPWVWRGAIAAGLAAMLLVGITIGRMSTRQPAQVATSSQPQQRTPAIVSPDTMSQLATVNPAPVPSAPHSIEPSPRGSQVETPRLAMVPSDRRAPLSVRDSLAYREAALRHLTSAEALLTSFRAEAQTGQVRGDVADWATDMLSTTRLLLDSPARNDKNLGPLLEDLELVLAQIARLRTQTDSTDVDLANQALRQHDMLPRIRGASAAMPSGT